MIGECTNARSSPRFASPAPTWRVTSRLSLAGILAGMNVLEVLDALRPLWLPSLLLSLAAAAGLALIAWG